MRDNRLNRVKSMNTFRNTQTSSLEMDSFANTRETFDNVRKSIQFRQPVKLSIEDIKERINGAHNMLKQVDQGVRPSGNFNKEGTGLIDSDHFLSVIRMFGLN